MIKGGVSMTGIYAIHNVANDKYYIGQAKDIHNRWIQHRSRLKCGTHENCHLQSAYNLYGKDSFEYLVLEECLEHQLNEKEQYYIEEYESYENGYNLDRGGAGCPGYKHTEEEIAKMRLIQNPKEVLQLDMNLNIVAEWVSCSHAGKTLGLSIRGIKAVCNRINRQKTIGGYYWIYKEEYENNTVDWDYYLNINESKPIRVSQYSLDMCLIKVWDSIYQICQECGYTASQITRNCRFDSKTAYNFIWRFTDSYTDEQYKKDCETEFKPTPNNSAIRISQYDLHMNLIRIWDSMRCITLECGWSSNGIRESCESLTKTSHDFVWRYTDKYTEENYQRDLQTIFLPTKKSEARPVLQYTLSGDFMQRYSSKNMASKATGISPKAIYDSCMGKVKKPKKFIFKFEDNSISQ